MDFKINVVNKHYHAPTEQDIYIARPTIFANPYSHLDNSKYDNVIKVSSREEAVKKYIDYFFKQYKQDEKFKEAIDILIELAKHSDINLCCFCAPLPCHADIIKKFIEKKLKENDNVK